jgi:RNA polymerase sigma-70 factor (ECF subfamily)
MVMLTIPLMEDVAEGAESLGRESEQLRVFFEEALPRVFGYFLHRCGGSVPVAEDLTQDTFLAAAGELRAGRRVELPMPWVLGIARHKLLDHYRRRDRIEGQLAVEAGVELDEIVLEAGEGARERAVSALAAVAAPQRAALVLFYLDGLSAAEVAAELGKSAAAVNSLLQRGRVSFKRAYLEAD